MVPVPLIEPGGVAEIVRAAQPLYSRLCLSVWAEMELDDQIALDKATSAAMGLDMSLIERVRHELIDLVRRRLARRRVV
jgi:hypothetical protein